MNWIRMIPGSRQLLLLCLLVLISACYEDKVGCLDALAENFSIDADEDCCAGKSDEDCCCNYPDLIFAFRHLYGDENLTLGRVYTNDLDQYFIPVQVSFVLSDIKLHKQSPFQITDSLQVSSGTETRWIRDDITAINRSAFQSVVGTFVEPGSFDSLSFSVGFEQPERPVVDQELDPSHPLDTSGNILYDPDFGYLMYHIKVVTDTLAGDTLVWQASAREPIRLAIDAPGSKERGRDLLISLRCNYEEWFRAIDLPTDDISTVRQKIRMGIERSISLVE